MGKLLWFKKALKVSFRTFICSAFCVLFVNEVFSQVVIYSTDFGTGTIYPAGWVPSGAQSANLEISTASASNSYTSPIGFSAGSNLHDGATGVTAGTAIAAVSGQIVTTGYTNIQVLFGAKKTSTYTGAVQFEWSNDGTNWNSIGFTDVTNDGNWYITNNGVWLSLPSGAENQSNLQFRFSFTRSNGSGEYRIDDFTVRGMAVSGSQSTDYFRSSQSGNWGTASTWESSSDNINWITATLIPTSSANTITIRNGHTVTIAADASADQLTIEAGGVLNHLNGITYTLDDGAGTDMDIYGTYIIYGPVPAGVGTYIVESGGVIQAKANNGGTADDIALSSNTRVLFKTGGIFDWNYNLTFGTGGFTYFPNSTERAIFRISSNLAIVGAGTNTVINGLLEINSSVSWGGAGTKTFRDGIIGTGSFTQNNTSGSFIINGTSAQLGGTGVITLNSGGLQIASPSIVNLISNKTIDGPGFSFTVNNGATFNCSAYIISGTSNFILSAGGKLGIGSADGITSAGSGNIQTTGRSYSSDANYVYNGITNQVTGNFITTPSANTVLTLTVANTGLAGNNTVTLTNDNTTATSLYLNNGYFASGTNQTLKIANNGAVYGNGGNNPNSANAGNIEFTGAGSTSGLADGNPSLYSVIINGGVDFNGATTHSATIMNQLQLKSGSYVTDAPYYNSGSSLVYSIGGLYGRNVEWGNTAGLPGYPYNVIVQASTTLDLNSNAISAPQLATGGDLTIGNSTGWGKVYMNNGMAIPLSIGGNLIIGSVDAASTSSELGLSNSLGGDLWLYGNFSRYNGSSYTDNDRAIFFKGPANASINTPNVAITPTIPTQYFSYAVVDKSTGAEVITLNCPAGISKLVTFNKGIITSSANNPLVVIDNANAAGASTSSFVNGPVKKIGDDDFSFPVGKLVIATPHYRLIGISGLSPDPTNAFTAEFRRESATAKGPVNSPGPPPLQWVSKCEYWTLDHNAGASTANVTLSWTAQSPCDQAYVTNLSYLVVAHFNTSTGKWDNHGSNSSTGTTTAGTVTWNNVSNFSPFSLGTTDVRYNPLPQPLNLVSFSAVSRKSDVLIDWSLTNNNDQEGYVLEHSRDGVNFEVLRVVPTKVILNLATYSEADSNPYYGWNYYRLYVTDKQNREKISSVVKVWYGLNELIRISPNPASEKIIINFSDPRSIYRIDLVNISGQVLKQVNTFQFTTEINISQLQAGMYYLRILDKNGLITKPFVKK